MIIVQHGGHLNTRVSPEDGSVERNPESSAYGFLFYPQSAF